MSAAEFKDFLFAEIRSKRFDAIFVDPLYKLMVGADHNAAGEVSAVLGHLEEITRVTGSSIIYADHYAKGNSALKKAIDRIAGSGVTARDPDAMIMFTELEDQLGQNDGRMAVEFVLRDLAPMKSFAVAKMEKSPLFERRNDLDPSRLAGTPGAKPKFSKTDLLFYMPDEGKITSEEWFKAVKLVTAMSEKTFKNLRAELKKDESVWTQKTGEHETIWVKTAKGIEMQRQSRPLEVAKNPVGSPDGDPFE